jgi:DNA helicase-2/ATP-dependent DNA helicase PcrA
MPLKVKLSDLRLLPDYVRKTIAENKSGTTALLFRLNDSMLPIIDMLYEKDIPFRCKGMDSLFFTHSSVTDVLSMLDFASDPFNTELFTKIYYKFNLNLSKAELQRALQYNTGEEPLPIVDYIASAPFIKDFKRQRAKKLSADLSKMASSDTYEALRILYFESGYEKYCLYRGADETKRNVLLSLSYKHRSRHAFKERLAKLEGAVKRGSLSDEGIFLSTIHSAKGMEFDRVILCDCKTGILPSEELPDGKKILVPDEIHLLEEERRLFYVGATRAKKYLELITWEKEFGVSADGFDFIEVFLNGEKKHPKIRVATPFVPPKPEQPSKRLSDEEYEEIAENYSVGTAVRHKTFGDGVIEEENGGFIVVRFARFKVPKRLELRTCIENSLIREI